MSDAIKQEQTAISGNFFFGKMLKINFPGPIQNLQTIHSPLTCVPLIKNHVQFPVFPVSKLDGHSEINTFRTTHIMMNVARKYFVTL